MLELIKIKRAGIALCVVKYYEQNRLEKNRKF